VKNSKSHYAPEAIIPSTPYQYLTMDPGYTFHEPAHSWSCLYEPPCS